jgi:hypothetical protein
MWGQGIFGACSNGQNRALRSCAAAALVLALAACSTPQAATPVAVAVATGAAKPPAECTSPSPRYPRLPDADVDDVGAARDRIAGQRAYNELVRRRAVCRAWHVGREREPASVPVPTI